MTIKLDRKKESLTRKLLEQERQATAELVDKQSREMMNLINEKFTEFTQVRKVCRKINAEQLRHTISPSRFSYYVS